ncbi:MAG TPA: hypothetical protein VK524_13395 [Polyangiaceae bacterium]|nr:hypothetical protein [Polyangiaceae bacterium]
MKHRIRIWAYFSVLFLLPSCGGIADSDESTQASGAATDSVIVAKPCASSSQCPASMHCTTEDGVCNRPPGCRPGDICPTVCYGTCRFTPAPVTCGSAVCGKGEFCCNASCSTCAPRGGACTQQVCETKL